jgi:CRP-like cAMP-binding protein
VLDTIKELNQGTELQRLPLHSRAIVSIQKHHPVSCGTIVIFSGHHTALIIQTSFEMYDLLFKYFSRYNATFFTNHETELIQDYFKPKRFKKRQYFLQEGEVCKYAAFILKGAMRKYRVDEKGEEHIMRLCIENWWVFEHESAMKGTPSDYFIDAWEDSECLLISKNDLIDLQVQIPAIFKLMATLESNFAVAMQKRIDAAIRLSAEERFCDLERTYPEFLKRFPQHVVASYLGISRETLSRIRCRNIKKESFY